MQDLPRERTMASAWSAVYNRGLGRAPSGVQGQSSWWEEFQVDKAT